MTRHPESSEKAADPDHVDPELTVLVSRLNESSAEIDDMEDAGAEGLQEMWRPIAEGRGGPVRQETPGNQPEMLHVASANTEEAAAAPKRRELPEELEELGHSFHSALFPGLNRPGGKQQVPEETGTSKTGASEGRISGKSALGMASFVVLVILGGVWFGSQMNMKILDLSKNLADLERQILESRASIQQTEQELGNIVQLQDENGQSIQRIERVVEDLRQSTKVDIEAFSEQLENLRDVSVVSDIHEAPAPAIEPSREWGVNLASFSSLDAATREMDRIRGMGIEVVTRVSMIADKRWYRLRVEGFSDRDEARNFIKQHHSRSEFSGAWISKAP